MSGVGAKFDAEVKAFDLWLKAGEPGDCPMCGASPGQAHGRNFCFGESPETDRPSPLEAALLAMSEEERAEALRPWEPYLVDITHVRWIIADFMGLGHHSEIDLTKVKEWLTAHGQSQHFAACMKCGAEAVHPFRERFEMPEVAS